MDSFQFFIYSATREMYAYTSECVLVTNRFAGGGMEKVGDGRKGGNRGVR